MIKQLESTEFTNCLAPIEDLPSTDINPDFDNCTIPKNIFSNPKNGVESVPHTEILIRLLETTQMIDFKELVVVNNGEESVTKNHYQICCVEQVLKNAKGYNWDICRHLDSIYLYNGSYWSSIDSKKFQKFLGEAAEKMGVNRYIARHFTFREQLYKQFLSASMIPRPDNNSDEVFINLQNGTFEIGPQKQSLRKPDCKDFITYQLDFDYNPEAISPLFFEYLNKVLPDIELQYILAEYLAYVFIKPSTLKLEKTLLLYGTGANGKSVFFEIVNALLGSENVSSYSLTSLTNESGYQRAKIADKLLNYASEINGKLETSIFKQLVSGEPVEARLPYGNPFTLTNYAKLIFNCNELPKEVEQTQAYFRRFLIVPFSVEIPENEQDKELSKKIIDNELSGIFNWVLIGLNRLLTQKNFTKSKAVSDQIEQYKKQSDSVLMFLEDEGFEKTQNDLMGFKDLFDLYIKYCRESRCHSISKKVFGDKLRKAGYVIARMNYGMVVYVNKISF